MNKKHIVNAVVSGFILQASTSFAQTVDLNFVTDLFDHSGSSSTGWNPSATTGIVTKNGLKTTVNVSYFGGASPDSNATPQNLDNGTFGSSVFVLALDQATSYNNTDPSAQKSLERYMRVDFEFDQAVTLDQFTLTDVDSRDNNNNDYTDGIYLESFSGAFGSAGSGDAVSYSNIGSHLSPKVAYGGLSVITLDDAFLGIDDNLPVNPVHSVDASYATATNRISLYYFNTRPPSNVAGTSEQVIGFGDIKVSVAPVPEPTSSLLLGVSSIAFCLRRKRSK